jgi:leucyl-tRNA synthetase
MKTETTKSNKINYIELAKKWTARWQDQNLYHMDLGSAKNPFYNLMMFPYPSAEGLHVGNMYAFTGSDVYGRFKRMKGFDVFEPIGLDGFGIHSENYALKIGAHPMTQSEISEKRFYEQLHMIGNAFDWGRTVETYKPDYYKWTQWLFIQLFNAGLAEKKKAEVNWCPSCKTVLADEQVIQKSKTTHSASSGSSKSQKSKAEEERVGVCERCEIQVVKKELEQWFFNITKYSERLLSDLDKIDWTKKVVLAQRNWIGKSEGAKIRFKIKDLRLKNIDESFLEVFTTRPDTLYGATFMAVSPKHELIVSLLNSKFKIRNSKLDEVRKYVEDAGRRAEADHEEREKTGVFSGLFAINPVNNKEIQIWISDYVLMDYGTGAVMAVPAHDKRDFDFAKKYELEILPVIATHDQATDEIECYETRGKIINSGDWDGWDSEVDFHKILQNLVEKKIGTPEVKYHLRDWLISRQRYWGTPIPMIYCEKCGWQAESEENLPVVLPHVENFKPIGTGDAPLSLDDEFIKTKCPQCGEDAKRETDVCDTFLDSSWYFLRYPSVGDSSQSFHKEITRKWLPVNMYIGGAEHSVLHLLYSRFVTKALFDLKLLDFDEPFTKFRAHGLLIKDGAKMSKSRGNIVNPDEYIARHGADTLRCYLMFLGPYQQGGDFRDSGIEGMEKFLKRVKRLVESEFEVSHESSSTVNKSLDSTIKAVSEDIENLRYNTAIAKLMSLTNILNENKGSISRDSLKKYLLMFSPFAPFMTEELWELMGESGSIHINSWPDFDEANIQKDTFDIAISVNGKLRGVISIPASNIDNKEMIIETAKKDPKIESYLSDTTPRQIIYVPGKILNFVV